MLNNNEQTSPVTRRTLGRYIVVRRLGRGGMADVWLCEDPRLHRQVAIKTLPAHSQDDYEYTRRFEREAQAAASLNHPHILSIHDYGQEKQDDLIIMYIVMPYIAGGSLADRMASYAAQSQLMPVQQALLFLLQAAEAIDYAHQQGIIHRDIKPANMLLRQDHWLLLADFGIAHIMTQNEQLTHSGIGFGTPEYMAPEQAQGRAVAASDTYSLAVLAYQLFTGSLPFMADNSYALTFQHITMEPPPPQRVNPTLSTRVSQVLLHGLEKDPTKRFADARTFVRELQAAFTLTAEEQTYASTMPPPLASTVEIRPASTTNKNETGQAAQQKLAVDHTKLRSVLTRRQLLIGGGVALLAAGGLTTWLIESRQHTQATTPSTPSPTTKSPTATSANIYGATMLLSGHNQPPRMIAWSPKANMLISCGSQNDNQVFLWDVDAAYQQKQQMPTSKVKQQFSNTALGILAAWASDGQHIALANAGDYGNGESVFVYKGDLSSPETGFLNAPIIVDSPVDTLQWLDNRFIIGTTTEITVPDGYFLHLWDSTQPKTTYTPTKIAGFLSYISDSLDETYYTALAVAPSGNMCAFATSDGVLVGKVENAGHTVMWKQSFPLLKLDNDGLQNVVGLAWSSDSQTIAAFTNEGKNVLHDVALLDATGKNQPAIHLADAHATSDFTVMAWSRARSRPLLAVATMTGTIYVWNLNGNAIVAKTLQGPASEVTGMAFSSDGQWLAAGFADTNASVLVWNM